MLIWIDVLKSFKYSCDHVKPLQKSSLKQSISQRDICEYIMGKSYQEHPSQARSKYWASKII